MALLTRRVIRWCRLILTFLVLGVTAALVYLSVFSISLNDYLPLVQRHAKNAGVELQTSNLSLDFAWGLRLTTSDLTLSESQHRLSADAASVTLSTSRLLIGQVRPKRIELESPDITLNLNGDTTVASPVTAGEFNFVAWLNNRGYRRNLPKELRALRFVDIRNGRIALRAADQMWHVAPLALRLEAGLTGQKGSIQCEITHRGRRGVIASSFSHTRLASTARFSLDMQLDSITLLGSQPLLAGIAEIDTPLALNFSGELSEPRFVDQGLVSITLGAGSLGLPTLYPKPFSLHELSLAGSYDYRNGDKLVLQRARVHTTDGVDLRVTGSVAQLTTNPQIDITATAEPFAIERAGQFVPPEAASGLYLWLNERLLNAAISEANFRARGPLAEFPFGEENSETELSARFSFRDLEVRYWGDRAPATGLDGTFELNRGLISINAAPDMQATIEDQSVEEMRVTIGDVILGERAEELILDGRLVGKTQTVLDVISPLIDTKPGEIKIGGTHRSNITLSLPLLKDVTFEQIALNVTSELERVVAEIPDLWAPVRTERATLRLAGDQLAVTADDATLGDDVLSVVFKQDIQAKGSGQSIQLRSVIGTARHRELWQGQPFSITGSTPLEISLERTSSSSYLYTFAADLTKNAVAAPRFRWEKASGESARLVSSGSIDALHSAITIDQFVLAAPAADIAIQGTIPTKRLADTDLTVRPLRLGDNRLAIRVMPGEIEIRGEQLDARTLEFDDSSEAQGNDIDLSLDLDKLLLADATLSDVHGTAKRRRGKWIDGDVSFRINAKAPTTFSIDTNGLLRAVTEDAGGLLNALGLYERLSGGSLDARFASNTNDPFEFNNGRGELTVKRAKLSDPPVLLRVIAVLSLDRLLRDGGTVFTEEISLDLISEPELLTFNNILIDIRGLTIRGSGTYNLTTKQLDIKLEAIPLDEISQLTENVPLIGKPISEAQRSITGFKVIVKGSPENPQISVSPFKGLL